MEQITPPATEWAFVAGSPYHDDPGWSNSSARVYQDPALAFAFAPQKALLSLLEHEDELQSELQMDTLYIPSSSHCFELKWVGSSPLWTRIRDQLLGYDTILINHLVKHFGARGFFYHEGTKSTVDLAYGVFNPEEASKSVRGDYAFAH